MLPTQAPLGAMTVARRLYWVPRGQGLWGRNCSSEGTLKTEGWQAGDCWGTLPAYGYKRATSQMNSLQKGMNILQSWKVRGARACSGHQTECSLPGSVGRLQVNGLFLLSGPNRSSSLLCRA